ncbi:glycoside hydrolase domain-containing protein [Planctomycetota bacterium]
MKTVRIFLISIILICFCSVGFSLPRQHQPYELVDPALTAGLQNLFLNAKVTVSSARKERPGNLAVDGIKNSPFKNWATDDDPGVFTLELAQPEMINNIRLWTFWHGYRFYKYYIETSLDGNNWERIIDQTENTAQALNHGESFFFGQRKVKYVRVTFTNWTTTDHRIGHIVEIEGYLAPEEILQQNEKWQLVPKGLQGYFGSIDKKYGKHHVPELEGSRSLKLVGWRGERLYGQIVLYAGERVDQVRFNCDALKNSKAKSLGKSALTANFVRYVRGDKTLCGDIIDDAQRLDIHAKTVRPIWLTVEIPRKAKPGNYTGKFHVKAAGDEQLEFDVAVEILGLTVPKPADFSFHIDLWQSPYASAAYHNVEFFSDEHFKILTPLMRMLADIGQKNVTAAIIDAPWNRQSFHRFGLLVEWTKKADGTWDYDYSKFDKWVNFCAKFGLDGQIECQTMVPWSNRFKYYDQALDEYVTFTAVPGTAEYEEHWTGFLKDFSRHLKKKGWLDRTAIAMDERPYEIMEKLFVFLKRVAPEFKISSAANYASELTDEIDDLCIYIGHTKKEDRPLIEERRARSKLTTFYVCCGPDRPNTFVFSPPIESVWLGWYTAANGFDGTLRWAFMTWIEEPLLDARHIKWPAGDCYLVYPGPRSSLRFERLREGIIDFEKLRIVRAKLEKLGTDGQKDIERLDSVLKVFDYENLGDDTQLAQNVNNAKQVLLELSRKID